jgi:hypothetical protein
MKVVTAEQAGLYRQITHRLRFERPGSPEVVSERPRDKKTRRYLDEDGTVVELREGDRVDVPFLLQIGGIQDG